MLCEPGAARLLVETDKAEAFDTRAVVLAKSVVLSTCSTLALKTSMAAIMAE